MSSVRRTANRNLRIAPELRAVITKYAMRDVGDTRILLCQPRAVELVFYPMPGNPQWAGNNGKVCYPSDVAAAMAAQDISAIKGAAPMQPYVCPRGGHYHHVDYGRARRTAGLIIRRIAQATHR
jgi:hypothetical protein